MKNNNSNKIVTNISDSKFAKDFCVIAHWILKYANSGIPKADFLREVCKIIIDFSKCDTLEIYTKENDRCYLCKTKNYSKKSFHFETHPYKQNEANIAISYFRDSSKLKYNDIIDNQDNPFFPYFTKNGSFLTGDISLFLKLHAKTKGKIIIYGDSISRYYKTIALIPLLYDSKYIGLLKLKSKKRDFIKQNEIEHYEGIAKIIIDALMNRRAQESLRERVKELTCLYGIAKIVEQTDKSLEKVLQDIVELFPPAWLHPEVGCARIVLDKRSYLTSFYKEGPQKMATDIIVNKKKRGVIEFMYSEKMPEIDDGPFLEEERSLLDTIANQIALIIENIQIENDKKELQNQLRHADRLSTVGQLAAGVAHELNEPIGNILGFAQLVKKSTEISKQTKNDIEKIEAASLHAREIVKKLLIFSRQLPPRILKTNLNKIVKDGIYFLKSRCEKEGIELVQEFSSNLPEIYADPSQLNQVLVNLVVNAIQAMKQGDKLTIRTTAGKDHVSLVVEDTGCGMNEDTLQQIYIPFFTTKKIGQGTGLGLSVTHGLVVSHGGQIKVKSKIGQGTVFEIKLPLPKKE